MPVLTVVERPPIVPDTYFAYIDGEWEGDYNDEGGMSDTIYFVWADSPESARVLLDRDQFEMDVEEGTLEGGDGRSYDDWYDFRDSFYVYNWQNASKLIYPPGIALVETESLGWDAFEEVSKSPLVRVPEYN